MRSIDMKHVIAFVIAGTARAQAAPAWRASADLDGDGKADTIELSIDPAGKPAKPVDPRVDQPCDADRCTGHLVAGGKSLDLAIHGGYFGGIGVRVVDVDTRDKRKQLLVTRYADGDEDPGFEFTLVMVVGDKLVARELGGGTSLDLDGKGAMIVHADSCPDETTVTFKLRGNDVVQTSRKTVRTRRPEQCAG